MNAVMLRDALSYTSLALLVTVRYQHAKCCWSVGSPLACLRLPCKTY